MEMEIFEEFSESNDQIIAKGKRTKRARPSSGGGRDRSGCSGLGGGGEVPNSLISSSNSTTSSGGISTSTQEDEDMANCLILLARGGCPNKVAQEETKVEKFRSQKMTETPSTTATNGKVGMYVYECKTCNRTFPSFQALGGHRASHKRPKPDHKKSAMDDHDEEEGQEGKFTTRLSSCSPSILNKSCRGDHHHNNKPKVHECSICGSEFSSGQALGGHMRRHRMAAKIGNNVETSMTSSSHDEEKPRTMLALDLNLPAPSEDDTEFQFPANLVFSAAPALVDCHY